MYPVSFLMNSGQYCEDLDEAFQEEVLPLLALPLCTAACTHFHFSCLED